MRDPTASDYSSLLHDPIGLCAACAHAKVIDNRRGSTFYLCRLSETDPRFPKYPRLPMLDCAGYEDSSVNPT